MELYIIIILICFIIILYFVDEIKVIYNIIHNIINKDILTNKDNLSNKNRLLLMYYNPILLKFYKQILIELKKINKYDYKSYFTQLNINLSYNNLLFFDWFIITHGIIKLGQDTIIKLIKSKQSIPNNFINAINKLYYYYYYIEKTFKNINISELNKFINKKFKNNTLINLYKIEELIYKLFIQYYKNLNLNKKYIKLIEPLVKDKNINIINSKLNIKFNKKNIPYSNLILINFFN
jgi:hypothetical protein